MHTFDSKIILICLFCLILSTQFAYSQSDETPIELNSTNVSIESFNSSSSTISLIDSVINFSKQYLGSPYRGGGKGPFSFDCSGFTSFVFNNFGIKLGSSSGDQAEQTPTIATNDIMPGDLVFFNGHRRGNRVGHVGMVVSKHDDGSFDFIHSASSVGISISNSESAYYSRRYLKAGRVLTFDSLIARNTIVQQNSLSVATSSTKQATSLEENIQIFLVNKTIPAKYHTVKKGETLSSIAGKYDLTVAQLKKQNDLKRDFLALKQRLKIEEEHQITVNEKVRPSVEVSVHTDSVKVQNNSLENDATENQLAYHVVKKGETLYSLSKQYGFSTTAFKEVNNLQSVNILAGQKLKVPTENYTTQHKPTVKQKAKTHTVKSGETLSEIAEKYNCTVRELKAWNNKSSNKLSLNEKLIIKS